MLFRSGELDVPVHFAFPYDSPLIGTFPEGPEVTNVARFVYGATFGGIARIIPSVPAFGSHIIYQPR